MQFFTLGSFRIPLPAGREPGLDLRSVIIVQYCAVPLIRLGFPSGFSFSALADTPVMSGFDFFDFHLCGAAFRSGAAGDKALVYEIFSCQTSRAVIWPPRIMKIGGHQPLFDNSGTRPFTLFNFQRSLKHYRRHLNDENGRLPYCTSNAIYEAKAKRSFLYDPIIHRVELGTGMDLLINN